MINVFGACILGRLSSPPRGIGNIKKWKYLMNPSLQGRQGAIGSDYKHREIKPVSADAFLGEAGEPMSDNCAGTLLVVRGPE